MMAIEREGERERDTHRERERERVDMTGACWCADSGCWKSSKSKGCLFYSRLGTGPLLLLAVHGKRAASFVNFGIVKSHQV